MAREVTARRDLEEVLAQSMHGLRNMIAFSGATIQLVDDDGWITVAACDPPAPAEVMERRIPLGNSIAGRVILTEQAIYVPDAGNDTRTLVLPTTESSRSIRSYLAVPLLADGRAIGMLRIDDVRPSAFSESDQLLIGAAATLVAAAIQSARADARVVSSRARGELLEGRQARIRALIDEARTGPLTDPTRNRVLLDSIEASLGDPLNDVDLRDPEHHGHLTT
jgi:GAF domain-containing protein